MRFRDYFGTLNNYTEDEYNKLKVECEKKAVYAVIGEEVGEKGTPHLQFFIYWKNEREFNAIKKLIPRAHLERKSTHSTFLEVSNYCKKEDKFYEYGILPVDRCVNKWTDIDTDIKSGMPWNELTSKYPEEAIKYVGGLKNHYETHRPQYKYSLPEPHRPFQDEIISYIENEVNDREILWVCDNGKTGKSKLADHLMSNYNVKVFANGKTADIAMAWNGENVVFDFSRSQQERINYGVLEDLKNGRIFSPKYQSCVKFFKPIHLIVFANFMPEVAKMTLDRWDIRTVSKDYKLINDDEECV